MESLKCKQCGKVIEGYNPNHVEHLMQQHQLKHEREAKNKNRDESQSHAVAPPKQSDKDERRT